jgi:hypothetical protein
VRTRPSFPRVQAEVAVVAPGPEEDAGRLVARAAGAFEAPAAGGLEAARGEIDYPP